mgnify:CR=1 FL=1
MHQSTEEISGRAVFRRTVVGKLQISTVGLESAAKVADQHDGPFIQTRMVGLARIAQVNNQRVVEHRTGPFRNTGKLRTKPRYQLCVESTQLDEAVLGRCSAKCVAVSDAMQIGNAKFRKLSELLATTDRTIADVANGAVRYAGSVGKLLG